MALIELFYTQMDGWDIERLQQVLTNSELQSIATISHSPTMRSKVIGKALVRSLLGERLGVNPKSLIFETNAYGKPTLSGDTTLHFNLSHSKEGLLIGLATEFPLGVDLEWVQPLEDEDGVAKRFFSTREYRDYSLLRLCDPAAFFRFWTAKEALIKALGKGIGSLENVPEIIVDAERLKVAKNGFELSELDIETGYRACLIFQHNRLEMFLEQPVFIELTTWQEGELGEKMIVAREHVGWKIFG